jgi:hypothetical protein
MNSDEVYMVIELVELRDGPAGPLLVNGIAG